MPSFPINCFLLNKSSAYLPQAIIYNVEKYENDLPDTTNIEHHTLVQCSGFCYYEWIWDWLISVGQKRNWRKNIFIISNLVENHDECCAFRKMSVWLVIIHFLLTWAGNGRCIIRCIWKHSVVVVVMVVVVVVRIFLVVFHLL